jgi:hypothetical protein
MVMRTRALLYGRRKAVFTDSAKRAYPIVRYGFKGSARRYTAVRVANGGIVHIPAYVTYIFLHITPPGIL